MLLHMTDFPHTIQAYSICGSSMSVMSNKDESYKHGGTNTILHESACRSVAVEATQSDLTYSSYTQSF